jgi:competence protein ComEC
MQFHFYRKGVLVLKCLLRALISISLISSLIFSACGFREASSGSRVMRVHCIDVGQGDSILIQAGGVNMLIDAGPADSADSLIAYLRKQDVQKLHYIIATHPHEDHIGGMASVIRKFEVGEFYAPRVTASSSCFAEMVSSLKRKGIKINPARAGIAIDLGSGSRCTMLAPSSESYGNLNNYSAVLKVTYGSSSFLFTGDAEELAEAEFAGSGADIDCDVLKAGHHGSSTSTSSLLLGAASPEIAVISVGRRNDFGHPSRKVLNSFDNMGVQVYRTDIDGTIFFESDGKRVMKKQNP